MGKEKRRMTSEGGHVKNSAVGPGFHRIEKRACPALLAFTKSYMGTAAPGGPPERVSAFRLSRFRASVPSATPKERSFPPLPHSSY